MWQILIVNGCLINIVSKKASTIHKLSRLKTKFVYYSGKKFRPFFLVKRVFVIYTCGVDYLFENVC